MVHHCRLTLTAVLHQVGAKMYSWPDPADPPDLADPADQVSLSAARSLPSTRAGGQDDVSFNKLPQNRNIGRATCIGNYIQPDFAYPRGPARAIYDNLS